MNRIAFVFLAFVTGVIGSSAPEGLSTLLFQILGGILLGWIATSDKLNLRVADVICGTGFGVFLGYALGPLIFRG